jgi:hypothetical protein
MDQMNAANVVAMDEFVHKIVNIKWQGHEPSFFYEGAVAREKQFKILGVSENLILIQRDLSNALGNHIYPSKIWIPISKIAAISVVK